MEEEIVSLKTAKLLKEKGFDESLSKGCPTQNIVQRWFREVHNIIILVDCRTHHAGWLSFEPDSEKMRIADWFYRIIINEDRYFTETTVNCNLHNYEDALEAAIEKALTLI